MSITELADWLRERDAKMEKRGAGEYDVVGISAWEYYGTARKLRGRWVAMDDGGRLRPEPFDTLGAVVRFIAREKALGT